MVRLLILILAIIAAATHAQHSNWVDRKEAEDVREALGRFYLDCGFYPDSIESLFEPADDQAGCLSAGAEKSRRKKASPLEDTPAHREAVSRLNYSAHGYHDYDLSLRLFWTRE